MTRLVAKLDPLTLNRLAGLPLKHPELRVADPAVDFDRRWTDWNAAGHLHDVRMRRRMAVVAWIVGAGLVVWSAALVLL
jgi:hypothetical protein